MRNIQEMIDLMAKFKPLSPPPRIVANKKNLDLLRERLAEAGVVSSPRIDNFDPLVRIDIIEDNSLPDEMATGKVIFPEDRFVEYEPSDAAWAVPLGLARMEMKPAVLLLDERFHERMDELFMSSQDFLRPLLSPTPPGNEP